MSEVLSGCAVRAEIQKERSMITMSLHRTLTDSAFQYWERVTHFFNAHGQVLHPGKLRDELVSLLAAALREDDTKPEQQPTEGQLANLCAYINSPARFMSKAEMRAVMMGDASLFAKAVTNDLKKAEPGDFVDRMVVEEKELGDKINKLVTFLTSDSFVRLSEIEQLLLEQQCAAMVNYRLLLNKRIDFYTTRKPDAS